MRPGAGKLVNWIQSNGDIILFRFFGWELSEGTGRTEKVLRAEDIRDVFPFPCSLAIAVKILKNIEIEGTVGKPCF